MCGRYHGRHFAAAKSPIDALRRWLAVLLKWAAGCTSFPGAPPSNWLVLAMTRPAVIPPGSWPRRMGAELAAGYCGESTVEAFIKRVGRDYPQPRITEGRRRLWLRDDLDQAILPPDLHRVRDVAEDL